MSGIDSSRRPMATSPRTRTESCGPTTAFQFATSTAFISPTLWNSLPQYPMMFW
ncbi:MAG: hypothetical protein M0040_02655 [Actinomycetota bacterium]|nr:hypothetical protein [Actinomycetota bacterium]